MASSAGGFSGALGGRWRQVARSGWVPVWSVPAAIRAARAAIVMPGLFAIADKVIGNPQIALFAAFGSFATLLFASFTGSRREKLAAHLGLALAGSVLLTIGTLVSSSVVLAAIVTVPVAFSVFFAGVAGANAASGITGALLSYVLPAASPGTIGMVPDRLAGWWLASVVGTAAVLALPAPTAGGGLRRAVAKLASVLAEEIEAVLRGEASERHLQVCIDAGRELLAEFNAAPFRPTGLAAPDQALANAVELAGWCTSLTVDSVHERTDLRDASPVDTELLMVAAAVLRSSGELIKGGEIRPDLERLEDCRTRSIARLHGLTPGSDDFRAQVQLAFHAQAISVTALAFGADAMVAARLAGVDWIADARARWFGSSTRGPGDERPLAGVFKYSAIALRHASVRSVWFINSARGALALAVAVAVADLSTVQHGFWVVLGTLSVLRTNAASTGSTALRALLGTAVGFAIGAGLLLVIGTGSAALWTALPIAVAVAAYAPGTAPFAVGQAAFTVTIAVLFNIIVPVGWRVGVIRIEDVAIGCVVSVVVGILFWPRGVSSVVGDDLADAYRSGADYLSHAVAWASGLRPDEPSGATAAVTAGLRLDEAMRAFLAEQGTKHLTKEQLWRLVGGTLRLRLTAHAVAVLPRDDTQDIDNIRAAIGGRTEVLHGFYERLAAQVGRPDGQTVVPLTAPTFDGGGADGAPDSRHGIWLTEHLDHLSEHLDELVLPAARLAAIRRRPWWR